MDERQTKITQGAGLEEARVNRDFIDFLQRWGPYVLIVGAVALLIPNGLAWWERQQDERRALAFDEYRAAAESGSMITPALEMFGPTRPQADVLLRVAEDLSGHAQLQGLLELRAADELLRSARLGVRDGTAPGPDGSLAPDQRLTDDERRQWYERAMTLYTRVLDDARDRRGNELKAIAAAFGAGASATGLLDSAKATAFYEDAGRLAEASGFTELAAVARERAAAVPQLVTLPPLAEPLQPAAAAPALEIPAAQVPPITGPSSTSTIEVVPPEAPSPTPPADPTGAPTTAPSNPGGG